MTTLSYETAKKLKDAGFPQHDNLIPGQADRAGQNWYEPKHLVMDEPELVEALGSENCKKRAAYCFTLQYLDSEEGKELTVYIPTLSELIEACGEGFRMLIHPVGNFYSAYSKYESDPNAIRATGTVPEEAVAALWLAIHTQKSG